MKTRPGRSSATRKVTLALLSLALACAVVLVTAARDGQGGTTASAKELYQQAVHQQEQVGNLDAAIDLYRRVLAAKPDRSLAASAQLQIAVCLDKLRRPEAAAAYEAVLGYGDQTKVAAVARTWLNAHGSTAKSQPSLRVERIWAGPDINMEGQPFPDGRHFVYSDWTNGPGNLAVRDLVTGETRFLTRGATYDDYVENPLLSPDGKQIAYRLGEKDSTIRLINADGSNMRILLRDEHNNYLHAWSADKKHIAAVHSNPDQTHAIVLISTVDGSAKQLKSTGLIYPGVGGFSPDGRFLVYALSKGPKDATGGVFLLASDGTRQVTLVPASEQGSTEFGAPVWSPDGRRVVFFSNRSGARALWSSRVTDGRPAGVPEALQAVVNADNVFPMGFTQDGAFFYGRREIEVEAYTAEFDPRAMKVMNPVPLTDQAVGNNRAPELSPDGASVAFIRRRGGMPFAVMVRSLTSGEERVVSTINGAGAYGARTLQWFPDGRSLLVIDGVNDQRKRFRQIDVNSGDAKVVFDGPWSVWTGALSADGKALFYSDKERAPSAKEEGTLRLMKRRLDTGEETELYRVQSDGTGLFGLVASPDGALLAFARNLEGAVRGLFTLPTTGGTPREIQREGFDKVMVRGISWTSDSRTLVVVGGTVGSDQQLFAISADGGALKPLGLKMPEISTAMLSPDGRRLVFGGRKVTEELWAIRNLLEPARAR